MSCFAYKVIRLKRKVPLDAGKMDNECFLLTLQIYCFYDEKAEIAFICSNFQNTFEMHIKEKKMKLHLMAVFQGN